MPVVDRKPRLPPRTERREVRDIIAAYTADLARLDPVWCVMRSDFVGRRFDLDEAYGAAWRRLHQSEDEIREIAREILPGVGRAELVAHLDQADIRVPVGVLSARLDAKIRAYRHMSDECCSASGRTSRCRGWCECRRWAGSDWRPLVR